MQNSVKGSVVQGAIKLATFSLFLKRSNTTSLFDKAFDRSTILAQKERYTTLHFATHATFVPGTPEDSFIVLGDGRQINLRDSADWKLPDTQLVVLSA